jgi:hypothetical protein
MASSKFSESTDPAVARAVTKALDVMADSLPQLLSMPDRAMISLESSIERSLTRALAGKQQNPSSGR